MRLRKSSIGFLIRPKGCHRYGAEWILQRILFPRFLLILLCFLCVGDVAWCQATGRNPTWSEPGDKVFGPPRFWPQSDRAVRGSKSRVMRKAAPIQIPDPENATISEEYGAGSIVIINRERKLYFVEEKGKAIRYPVAIGSPADEWQGVQTIAAKRENES